ncbi:hypothetical protein KUCAC02_006704 [Chaenocephalus aceratus]|uniref:Uncharacterized protein n=1 Tax=Chaenocephalus aceratus TaxID=36190 RepID=A0ACB9VSN0_CHAAC|nr:hypothetical protein KUCAC02_006704 [Chaenocephalus aceratus]
MMIQQNDAVDVTLDAHTAYTKLVVSEDGKQLRFDEGLPPPDPFSPQIYHTLGETRRGGKRLGGAHSTVVTSRERPSSGEATSGGAGIDGKEGKRDRRERQETARQETVRQRDRYDAGRQAPIESVSSQLTVCWATVDKSRHLTAAE